jgi:DNA polymerase-1
LIQYISNIEQASVVVKKLVDEHEIGLDIETTGLDPILDKIRLVQIATPLNTYVMDMYHVPISVLKPVLNGGPVKVIHNAKFDAGFLYMLPEGVMTEPIFDTMITDQVLHHRGYARSLKDLSKEYLDIELDKENQTSDWGAEQLSESQIQYAAQDANVLLPLKHILEEKAMELQVMEVVNLENRLVPAICWMERSGVHLDRNLWGELVKSAEAKAIQLKEELNLSVAEHTSLGLDLFGNAAVSVNWDSPAQVKKLLSDLGVAIENTRHSTLEANRGAHPVIALLLDYRGAAKKVSTYGTDWEKHVHPTSQRIHANWVQIGAATGRMSCKNPNMQNLPRETAYRNCFRAAPDCVLIKADYEQIELRLAAQIAPDARMKEAFYQGRDLHSVTASHLLGKPETEVVTDSQRQMAKAVNFGLIFGMGARGLSSYAQINFRVKMDEHEAAKIRRRYFEAYSGIKKWHESQSRKLETRTILGRHRILKGERDYTNRLNSPIQGSAADGLKLALIKLWETRHQINAYPVLTVHDEIVIEAPKELAEKAAKWLKKCMEDGMGEFLHEIPVAVDITAKESWG